MTGLTADYFDQWYADMASAPVLEDAKQRILGLPAELQSTSLLTFDGLAEVAAALDLHPGERLLDLACGRGGYGLWLARKTGAHLVGVDFSPVAVRAAEQAVPVFGLAGRAEFRVGELEATGLPDASVDALMCIDAIQFAGSAQAAAEEAARVLTPGGTVAVTCWEARERTDEALPERMRSLDLSEALTAGGLVDVRVEERPDWLATERAYWDEAVACDPAGDAALQSWHDEGARALPALDRMRRVLAIGRAPS